MGFLEAFLRNLWEVRRVNSMILIAFLGLVTGSFLLLGTSPFEIIGDISKQFQVKEKSLKSKIKEVTQ